MLNLTSNSEKMLYIAAVPRLAAIWMLSRWATNKIKRQSLLVQEGFTTDHGC